MEPHEDTHLEPPPSLPSSLSPTAFRCLKRLARALFPGVYHVAHPAVHACSANACVARARWSHKFIGPLLRGRHLHARVPTGTAPQNVHAHNLIHVHRPGLPSCDSHPHMLSPLFPPPPFASIYCVHRRTRPRACHPPLSPPLLPPYHARWCLTAAGICSDDCANPNYHVMSLFSNTRPDWGRLLALFVRYEWSLTRTRTLNHPPRCLPASHPRLSAASNG